MDERVPVSIRFENEGKLDEHGTGTTPRSRSCKRHIGYAERKACSKAILSILRPARLSL